MSSSGSLPVTIAQWSRNARHTVIVRIDQFNGTVVIDIRDWWTSHTGELRPGPSGITMSVRHLPALAHALTKAEATARELGLLTEPDETPEGI
jgi:Transcriptional Coactivator p15 (PC4)